MEPTSYELKVTALMTAPRHEIVLSRNYIEIALKNAGIPLAISGGVFYGQCMQRMLENAIGKGLDVAITVDFDSMFVDKDVLRLLQKLVSNDEIDAVAALQCRRGKRFPLMTKKGVNHQVVCGQPFQVDTAHFGLTAIDLHRLRDVPKPWFNSEPDRYGEWSDDRIDDDIWFWRQWAGSDRSVYIDPETRIGHMEEMVTIMDDGMNPQHVYPHDWAADAYNSRVNAKGVLVFVGANFGGEELDTLCEKHQHSYLFEPLPEAATKLRDVTATMASVEVVEAACADFEGAGTLRVYNELGLSSSLGVMTDQARDAFPNFNLECSGRRTVRVVRLNDWLIDRGIDEIETLVIDAQGMDLTILQTLEPMLAAGKIHNIQCEADGDGFTHYSDVPSNAEADFQAFMSQFPHYAGTRLMGRLGIQPDLIWTLNQEAAMPCGVV